MYPEYVSTDIYKNKYLYCDFTKMRYNEKKVHTKLLTLYTETLDGNVVHGGIKYL